MPALPVGGGANLPTGSKDRLTMPRTAAPAIPSALPTLTFVPDLEHILHQLHDSEINAGVQTFFDAGMRVWIGDEFNGIRAETAINRTRSARLKWPGGLTAARWLHETALRLYPDSRYAQEHSTEAPKKPAKN
jgi:hypothetical protein